MDIEDVKSLLDNPDCEIQSRLVEGQMDFIYESTHSSPTMTVVQSLLLSSPVDKCDGWMGATAG